MMRKSYPSPNADPDCAASVDVPAMEPICVRIATAVELTGIGRSTLYELIAAGEIEIPTTV